MSLDMLSILVVEDNPTNQVLIKQQLQFLGHHVELVENGKAALKLLAAERFDIILTDINMPEMDGYQLAREVRTAYDSRISSLPIIAITANATESDKKKCCAAGMDGFLTKPIEINFLKNFLLDLHKNNGQAGHETHCSKPEKSDNNPAIETISNFNSEVLELSVISNFVGGDEQLIQKLLKVFLKQTPSIIDEIHVSCVSDNTTSVVSSSHKLKSSARSVGANRLADLCVALESAGKENRLTDMKEIESRIDDVFTETQAAIVNLNS